MAKNTDGDDKSGRSIRKLGNLTLLWRHATRYPKQILFAGIALLVAALGTLAIPRQLQKVVDDGFAALGTNAADIAPFFHYLLLIVVVLAVATALRFYFVSWLGERVVADIRLAVQRNLLRQSPGFFEENRPSEIASRMTADTAIVEQIVGTTVSVALRNLVVGIGGIIYLFYLAPQLTAYLLIGIPLIIVPIVIIGRKLENVSKSSQDRVADVGATTTETLGAMKIVQAFGQQEREAERFAGSVERTFETAKKRIKLRSLLTLVIITLIFGAITGIMWQGAVDVVEGRLTGGTIAAFIFAGVLVAGSFGALTEVYGDLLRAAGASSRLNELLNAEPDIAAPAKPVDLPLPPRGQLSFQKVTFRYPTRQDIPAIEDFSLTVAPGETVAIVGPSGAGKSTIFQLAQRFYDPEAGTIRIDGVALPSADPADVRERMAYVPQESVLFAASARDNLRYGNWNASDEEIWAAAEAANAAEFIRALPEGLDSYLGEAGTRLSGGQRQRISIARALLRNAPILLLDEATSALDAESEQLVQQAFDRLMENRTTLVIAHRLATIRAADRIVVMDEGRIVEEGNHTELSASQGLYARLASLQFDMPPRAEAVAAK
ncbi:ABC transporter transmembrane domain-containing protein [Alterisphingorhabdus coralli]|uniref:ABC transporter transmembrane domain-containing protein n=1 Tax=Alterisphingorhabdus coralli TaxID=3071408 RepID=A0AA97I132_9SPHN|nr:ABC transporter transmembrane domain-containing protein [Parasphingorhabdus sp. SCSIO 66989]WOE74850.1 ABC transporter transmembrane domain-containing protein [Parasphingorhabdus sp. SCSIO 66989]